MSGILLGPLHIYAAFKELGNNAKLQFVDLLDRKGHLHLIKDRLLEAARRKRHSLEEQVRLLTERVKRLEAENAAIRRQAKTRMTPAQRKQRLVELNAEGWSAREIAERLSHEGERMSAGAVRVALWRMKRA